jgi:hypothetical protein
LSDSARSASRFTCTALDARSANGHLELAATRYPLNDFLADAVGEELHLGVVGQVVEREHGEQRSGGRRGGRRRCGGLGHALRLFRAWRRHQRVSAGGRHFADLHRVVDAGHPVQPVHGPAQRGLVGMAHRTPAREVVGRARHQDAPLAGERHHARGGGLGQALDLHRLGASRDVGRRVLAQHHLAEMNAHARGEGSLRLGTEFE